MTVDGKLMHQNVHDQSRCESRGDLLIFYGMNVFSSSLGVSGQCDVVEFHRNPEGISLQGWEGLWQPYPVEYKRGKPKSHTADKLQLCAQAMCLEEILCCQIPEGSLFYGEPKRRTVVSFTEELRQEVRDCFAEMHNLYERSYTPKVKPKKGCGNCSHKEICLPKLMRTKSVQRYLKESMEEIK